MMKIKNISLAVILCFFFIFPSMSETQKLNILEKVTDEERSLPIALYSIERCIALFQIVEGIQRQDIQKRKETVMAAERYQKKWRRLLKIYEQLSSVASIPIDIKEFGEKNTMIQNAYVKGMTEAKVLTGHYSKDRIFRSDLPFCNKSLDQYIEEIVLENIPMSNK